MGSPSASSILSSFSSQRISGHYCAPRETSQISIHYGDNILRASNCRHCSPCLSNPVCARRRYVVMPTFVQPLDRNQVASMNFCPLDISRRASSARAPISSFSHGGGAAVVCGDAAAGAGAGGMFGIARPGVRARITRRLPLGISVKHLTNSSPDQRRHLQWHNSSSSRTQSPPQQKHGFRGCHIPTASSKFCFGFTKSCSALNRSLKATSTYSLEATLWLLTANISLGLAAV